MKLSRLLPLSLLLFPWPALAQTTPADSPERALATAIAFAGDAQQEKLLNDCADLVSPELVRRLVDAGTVLGSKGMIAREERLATIALSLADKLRDPSSRARALWLLARAEDTQDRYDDAFAHYEEARQLALTSGDQQTVGRALIGQGWTWVSRYDFTKAESLLRQGLAIAVAVGDDMIADNAHLALANAHNVKGEYIDALREYDLARQYAEKAGDRVAVAAATANSGLVFDAMNNNVLAAERLREAIAIYHEIGNTRGEMRNLRSLADVEAASSEEERAAVHLDQVDAWLQKNPNDRMAAFAAATRGKIAMSHGNLAAADRQAQRALDLATKVNETYLVEIETNALSEIRLAQKRYGEAAALAETAIALSRRPEGRFDHDWIAELNAAKAYRKLGRTADAERSLHAAIDSIEGSVANVPGTYEEQQTFYETKSGPYYELFSLLVARHRVDEGLAWAERARGRTLMEYLGRGNVSADRNMLSPTERSEEGALEQEIVTLNRALREQNSQEKRDEKRIAEIEDAVRHKKIALRDLMARLYGEHAGLSLSRGAFPRISTADVQALIPKDGAIVEYFAADDVLWCVVLTHGQAPHVYPIDAGYAELRRRANAFARRIASRRLGIDREARTWFSLLLGPAYPMLRGKKSLCIIPDGPLWLLPFQAFVEGDGRYLIERKTLFYAPSLSFLAWYAKHPHDSHAAAGILAIGNPQLIERTTTIARAVHRDEQLAPLPDAEDEVRRIASLYGNEANVLTGKNATEERVKRDAGRYRIIHIATHATFDDANPLYSHLVLATPRESSEDGLLEAHEILNLDLSADLVVLSSCETGRGNLRGGDGLVGMSWALLVAGCPTAVVSQWKVGSANTERLMVDFHRRLARVPPARRRQAAAGALSAAERAFLRSGHHEPYDWSGFMVVGNGW